jgi:hypothetical protein
MIHPQAVDGGDRFQTNHMDEQPTLRKLDMRFGMRKVGSLYRACSFMKVVNEIWKCKLYLVQVQQCRWNRGDTQSAGEYIFFLRKVE